MRLSLRLASALLLVSTGAQAQLLERVSVDSSGAQGNAASFGGALSANGRYVAFESLATNLVAGDTNAQADIFVRDRQTGQTTRVSVGPAGVQGNGISSSAAISADGRFVAFRSMATNLVASDTNGMTMDVFVHDRISGVTEIASVSSAGVQGNQNSFSIPSISGDGRYVSFASGADNLVPSDSNDRPDVFVRDRLSGQTRRVSVSSAGAQCSGDVDYNAISADGRYVVFESSAFGLVPVDHGNYDIFVHDLVTGQTTLEDVDSAGHPSEGNSTDNVVAISADGRYVSFWSSARDLVPGDDNLTTDVFVHDRVTGATRRASVTSPGGEANGYSAAGALSADGRYVQFSSVAGNLAPGDTNGVYDSFLHDAITGVTTLLSAVPGGAANGTSYGRSLSASGRLAAFNSTAPNLVPNDTNASSDVFVLDQLGFEPPAVVCAGDGGGSACPCANAGAAWHGCSNSTSAGARLLSSGIPSVSADTFALDASGMTPSTSALFFQGTTLAVGGAGAPFGDGLRCAGGTSMRLGTKSATNGGVRFGAPLGDVPISVRGAIPVGGGTFVYQVHYRDAASFCTSHAFNLTNALSTLWTP